MAITIVNRVKLNMEMRMNKMDKEEIKELLKESLEIQVECCIDAMNPKPYMKLTILFDNEPIDFVCWDK